MKYEKRSDYIFYESPHGLLYDGPVTSVQPGPPQTSQDLWRQDVTSADLLTLTVLMAGVIPQDVERQPGLLQPLGHGRRLPAGQPAV